MRYRGHDAGPIATELVTTTSATMTHVFQDNQRFLYDLKETTFSYLITNRLLSTDCAVFN